MIAEILSKSYEIYQKANRFTWRNAAHFHVNEDRKKKLDKITKSSQCLQTCTLELLTNLNSFVTKITKDPFELSPENSNFRTTKQFHGFYL